MKSSKRSPALDLSLNTWRGVHPHSAEVPPAAVVDAAQAIACHLLRTQFLLAYDARAQQTLFISPGVELLLGLRAEEVTLEALDKRMHPDDAPFVGEAIALTAMFEVSLGAAYHGHVFSIDYRLRHAAGHYVRLLRQNVALQHDATGMLVATGAIFTDLTAHKHTSEVRFHCTHPEYPAWMAAHVLPSSKPELSRRELEVLALVLKGCGSAEIAGRLCVSVHTVNTHRRNIHRKEPDRDLSHLLLRLDP